MNNREIYNNLIDKLRDNTYKFYMENENNFYVILDKNENNILDNFSNKQLAFIYKNYLKEIYKPYTKMNNIEKLKFNIHNCISYEIEYREINNKFNINLF